LEVVIGAELIEIVPSRDVLAVVPVQRKNSGGLRHVVAVNGKPNLNLVVSTVRLVELK